MRNKQRACDKKEKKTMMIVIELATIESIHVAIESLNQQQSSLKLFTAQIRLRKIESLIGMKISWNHFPVYMSQ